MDQQRQGTRSTNTSLINPDTMEDVPQFTNNNRSHPIYMTITDLDGNLYSDQTGRLTIISNRGNCSVVIFFAVDGNYIKYYPNKSQHCSQLLKEYDDV